MANKSIQLLSIFVVLLGLWCLSDATKYRKMVGIYELRKGDFSIRVTNWGATIISVVVPDKQGKLADIVLGYDKISSYVVGTSYFGALVGRVANRIAGSRFTINGTPYHLYCNNGNNSLHGGHRGYSAVIWDVIEKVDGDFPYITFYYNSFDGEQGFPGDVDVHVTYKISPDYKLTVTMHAKPQNKLTPINLAQHSYWNLGGHSSGNILNHRVQIFASHITPVDSELIPTGEIASVDNTPFDFRKPMTVGSRISQLKGGYDHNYVVDSTPDELGLRRVAVVEESQSGRVMELWANQPGVQFYTGNFLNGTEGKGGAKYMQHAALCLETQDYPDAVHHPNFPNEIYGPGQAYEHVMVYKFSARK
ncbi:Aldose 1-epimerase [Rhynchospora pubera]|uniref:Aldose 1-epimerase n=1 Tax=Rhynchospora pubera TaxID=906938 RepID=A0AAV8CD70_9POAL|nr:Aldose 1-epimerase [Rhynchospora pubera]